MDRQWLAEQVEKGRWDKDIAEESGISATMVGYHRRKWGISSNRGRKIPDRQWLVDQVAQDRSDKQIAEMLGVTVTVVGQWRRRMDVPARPRQQRALAMYREHYPNGRHGAEAANWRGGRRSTTGKKPGGYIRIYMPEHPNADGHGYVYEHRYVMEQKLGRLLKSGEIVDHIDRNRSNNAPDNLQLHESRAQHVKDHFSARDQLTVAMKKIEHYESIVMQMGDLLQLAANIGAFVCPLAGQSEKPAEHTRVCPACQVRELLSPRWIVAPETEMEGRLHRHAELQ